MERWAFARISLKLTDAEFFSYTPEETNQLTKTWSEERQWEYAVAMAAASSARWGNEERPIPFLPKDFMPPTPEETKKREADLAKLEKAQQKFFAAGLTALSKRLQKPER